MNDAVNRGKILALKRGNVWLFPRLADDVFVAHTAVIIGDVRIGRSSSVWYNAVLRADDNWIEIGQGTNIRDGVVVHVETSMFPTFIGDFVTIGHRSVIHGCVIKDFSLVGIGAVIMNGAEVGPFSIVGAGAVVTESSRIPPGTLAVGVPAKVRRELREEEIEILKRSAYGYIELSKRHLKFTKDTGNI